MKPLWPGCNLLMIQWTNSKFSITPRSQWCRVVVVSLSCRYCLHCDHKNDTITTRHIVTAQNDKTTTRHIVTALCRWDVVLVSSNCRVVVASFCVVTMKIVGMSLGCSSRVVRLYDRKSQIHLIFFRELSNRFEVSFGNGVEYST